MSERRILVLGYGNPGRQDDGLGPAIAQAIEASGEPGVTADADYQLNIEDAATLAEHNAAVFVDASVDALEPFSFGRLEPAEATSFSSHSVSPGAVLSICEKHFGARPEVWVLAIRGYAFEFAEGLTPRARENFEQALAFVRRTIAAWRRGEPTPRPDVATVPGDPVARDAEASPK